MRRALWLGLAGAVVMATSVDARAQSWRIDERFAGMDRDRNGVITRDEWNGSETSFRVHDWNNDGVLSGDEIRPGATRPNRDRGFEQEDYAYNRNYEFNDWTPRAFSSLDDNRDGRIARNEWHFSWQSFRRADHNSDGVITRSEFLNQPNWVDDDRDDSFESLDRDRDGYVTRGEWHGSVRAFQNLDANRDGRLSRREVVGESDRIDDFSSLDVDRNGVISEREWHWSRQSFQNLDDNRDGVLTRDEFRRSSGVVANQRPSSPAEPPAPTVNYAYRAGQERGLVEGRQAGREDRERRQGWDLEGQRELEQADSGYQPSLGDRSQYQAGYREAFRRGYREGYGTT